jgi:putative sterol carrier protein
LATKTDIIDALQKWVELLENEPELAEQFEGYNKTLIILPDIDFSVQMVFEGTNRAHLVEGTTENPDMSFTIDSDTFLGICNGEIDPMELFMMGELNLKGNMDDLQKLEVFIDLFEEDE